MPNHIRSIKYFGCGYCENNLGLVLKKWPKERRRFPAGAFLMNHDAYGLILFDTGYSTNIYRSGLIGKMYCCFNPTKVTTNDTIYHQLRSENIETDCIKTIILSHLHPDHVGGLMDFPKAGFVIAEEAMDAYRSGKMRDLIIKDFFPSDFERRVKMITDKQMNKKVLDGMLGYDFFGDGSLILIKLGGHACGQLCALINNKILLAADSCWGNDLLDASYCMRFPVTLIQSDMNAYRRTLRILTELKDGGIRLVFSHDIDTPKELL